MTTEVEVDLDAFEHKFSSELFDGIKCSAETVALIEDNFIEE